MSTFQELLEKMGLKGHKENTEALGFSERMKKMFHMKEKSVMFLRGFLIFFRKRDCFRI